LVNQESKKCITKNDFPELGYIMVIQVQLNPISGKFEIDLKQLQTRNLYLRIENDEGNFQN
jgi:hypothetical protein